MTIDEAIRLLQDLFGSNILDPLPQYKAGVWLGVAALERVKDMRISPCTTSDEILPGETEE